MRKINVDTLNNLISDKRKHVNEKMFIERQSYPKTKRTRVRTIDERMALTKITEATIKRALSEGKLKVTGERKLYYASSE